MTNEPRKMIEIRSTLRMNKECRIELVPVPGFPLTAAGVVIATGLSGLLIRDQYSSAEEFYPWVQVRKVTQ